MNTEADSERFFEKRLRGGESWLIATIPSFLCIVRTHIRNSLCVLPRSRRGGYPATIARQEAYRLGPFSLTPQKSRSKALGKRSITKLCLFVCSIDLESDQRRIFARADCGPLTRKNFTM